MTETRSSLALRLTVVCLLLVTATAAPKADLSTGNSGATTPPTVTITQVTPQTRNTPVDSIEIVFSEAVTGVTINDFTLSPFPLTGSETISTTDNITYTLEDLGSLTTTTSYSYSLTLTAAGSGIANLGAEPLAVGASMSWIMDTYPPDVTIDQSCCQVDPVGYGASVVFTAVFNKPIDITTFDSTDIDLTAGTATGTSIDVVETDPFDATTFSVTVHGTTPGDLIATIPAGGVTDAAGNPNNASTSTDNTVTILSCGALALVTNTDDSGPGSLRDTIDTACNAAIINFDIAGPGPHVITLTSPVVIEQVVDILGPEDEAVILDGGGVNELMVIDVTGDAVIAGLTFRNAYSLGEGAALANFGVAVVTNSLFTGNFSESDGGAIVNEGFMDLGNTTISGNSSAGNGGGIFNCDGGSLGLLNLTITNNQALGLGGGLYNITVVQHENTIISGNTAATDGHNVYDDDFGLTVDVGHSIIDEDALLGPLQDNGGPTLSHAPLAGSPAIDGGSNTTLIFNDITSDQRGSAFGRFRDGGDANLAQTADIGAIEADPAVEDITNKSTSEGVALAVLFNVGDSTTPFDSIVATSSNTTLFPNNQLVISEMSPGQRSLSMTPAADAFGSSTITVTVSKTLGGVLLSMVDTFVVTVAPGASTPTITNASTFEDTLSTSGLVISRNATDGAEVTHFKIITVSGGTLFKTDGITPILPNAFITFAEGNAGLKFLPAPNTFGAAAGAVSVQASLNATNTGLGGNSAAGVVTVYPVADTPSITNAFTNINQQTTSGLVIARNPADGAEVTHYQVTAVTGGQLFHADGVTPIAASSFITAAEGYAGLSFSPTTDSTATGHVSVRASLTPALDGVGGATATGDIYIVTPTAFTDDPIVPGVTVIRAIHLLELRIRINAQRVRFQLPEFTLHNPVVGVTVITAPQILQLRTALTEAYAAALMAAPTFTDPGLPPGTMIKAVHFQELRAKILALEAHP